MKSMSDLHEDKQENTRQTFLNLNSRGLINPTLYCFSFSYGSKITKIPRELRKL